MHVFNLYMIHGHYFFKLCTGTYVLYKVNLMTEELGLHWKKIRL